MRKRRRRYEEDWDDEEEEYEDEDEYEEDDEEEEVTTKELIQIAKRRLKTLTPGSTEAKQTAEYLEMLTTCERNEKEGREAEANEQIAKSAKMENFIGHAFNFAGTVAGNAVGAVLNRKNFKDMIRFEDDGGIHTSKAAMCLAKPRSY